jgi:hypothetical protein
LTIKNNIESLRSGFQRDQAARWRLFPEKRSGAASMEYNEDKSLGCQPRDDFSNRLISRSRLRRDSRLIQNIPLSWSISC